MVHMLVSFNFVVIFQAISVIVVHILYWKIAVCKLI